MSPTQNTKAALLLTAPLILSRTDPEAKLLSPGEYRRFGGRLTERGYQLQALLEPGVYDLVELGCQQDIDVSRVHQLLGRGFLLTQVLERWGALNIRVVSEGDEGYPSRYINRLNHNAPPVIYGCGDIALCETGGLAIVGSRHVDDEILEWTEEIGRLAARSGCTVVSGGARGVDQSAMRGGLERGGMVVGVLADSMERSVLNTSHRQAIMDGQLLLMSPYDPKAGFNAGNAMQRNKLVYALADAALVVNCDLEKGGTWAGAVEQLTKNKKGTGITVYVRAASDAGGALQALKAKGAVDWPNPNDSDALTEALKNPAKPEVVQPELPVGDLAVLREPATPYQQAPTITTSVTSEDDSAAIQLFKLVSELILAMPGLITEVAVAERLSIPKAHAKDWIKRLVDADKLEKTKDGFKRPFRLFDDA